MLIKMLPYEKKALLVELDRLLALSDNPLLWDGKTKDELTSDSDLNNLTIQKDSLETELLEEMEQYSPGLSDKGVFGGVFSRSAEDNLIEKLKVYPLSRIDAPGSRIQAATAVLKILLEDKKTENLATPKIIIFQLFLVALRDGQISSIEWMLLKDIQLYFKVPDFIFKDLLDRAEELNSEVSKTLSLIIE
ncbi:hypothetical protein EDC48_10233 [Gibbsiella quercinecans]|uniref:Co-chaperone DjlA N-terminal domain-containing protein n=1 Tax=Gibbsiella quercinecans TaxID=929813 RepID=A0A250AYP4_9GAMM|nr:hypothetical protein [Gibbsiella quercinecans]ATA18936.1 hypothetical protein AWC35_06035 [Gibbsiella quercinecans]RLM02711.1 hypothetical protein BIY30_23385 [Gibbsiella quercinecans]TCT91511.1 hypothetical protein EDC48_10233 [Gibbsiella quercinecans]